MDGKKISFSFSKVKKAEKPASQSEKRDYIDCLEGKSIKIIGEEHVEKRDLVIYMKPNTKSSNETMAKIAEEVESAVNEENREIKTAFGVRGAPCVLPVNDHETLEQRAAREILEDLSSKNDKVASKVFSVPLLNEMPLTGEKESTLEDYENIPISDFGMAMLRGMGWESGVAVDKKERFSKHSQPTLRPKGLGLGADKVVKQQDRTYNGANIEEIKVKKGTYLKITTGTHSGRYGQINGFDEDSGRLIVELSSNGGSINISEFMVQLLSKNEYDKQSRVINSSKYEEYKKRDEVESEKLEKQEKEIDDIHSYGKKERINSPYSRSKDQSESNRGNGGSYSKRTERPYSSGSEGDHRIEKDKPKSGKMGKCDSRSNPGGSDSSVDLSRNKTKHSSSRRRSQSGPHMLQLERDKKRKGKKKKRDRSRSPNYRKYKK